MTAIATFLGVLGGEGGDADEEPVELRIDLMLIESESAWRKNNQRLVIVWKRHAVLGMLPKIGTLMPAHTFGLDLTTAGPEPSPFPSSTHLSHTLLRTCHPSTPQMPAAHTIGWLLPVQTVMKGLSLGRCSASTLAPLFATGVSP